MLIQAECLASPLNWHLTYCLGNWSLLVSVSFADLQTTLWSRRKRQMLRVVFCTSPRAVSAHLHPEDLLDVWHVPILCKEKKAGR